jgi:hypothetical protein
MGQLKGLQHRELLDKLRDRLKVEYLLQSFSNWQYPSSMMVVNMLMIAISIITTITTIDMAIMDTVITIIIIKAFLSVL